jgi:hypothetical protein
MRKLVAVEKILPQEADWELLVQCRLRGRIRDLRVIIRPGGLILQGRAATYHAKQLAQHAAMELSGQRILANQIEVRQSGTGSDTGLLKGIALFDHAGVGPVDPAVHIAAPAKLDQQG